MSRSLSSPGWLASLVLAGTVVATIGWLAPAGYADETSPKCATPTIDSGTLTPPMPGVVVNTGTPTVSVTGHTEGACGWGSDASLHYWSADPSWFQGADPATLGSSPVPAGSFTVTKTEATGTTDTTLRVPVPASGAFWVGVRYRIPDAGPSLGFGVNESALLPTRIVVREAPTINAPPAVLAHDNTNTPLSGTAWPGDTVTVTDQNGKPVCTATADASGTWSCTAAATFPPGTTKLTVTEHGTGANNPAYPGLTDAGLTDLPGNTVATHVITADPAVTKSIDNASPHLGDEVHYTVTATNNGPDTAVDVSVADALPAGLTYVSATATAGTFDQATGAWTGIGDLAKGATQKLTITAKVTAHGTITNPATIKATAATDGVNTSRLTGADGVPDWNTNPANDADKAVLTTVPSADPQVRKEADRRAHQVGDVVTYTLTATNNGPDAATGVTVTDALPDGLAYVSAQPSVGTFDETTMTWTVGTLSTTDTATLTMQAKIEKAGTFENAAVITANEAASGGVASRRATDVDTNPANDRDTAVVEAAAPAGAKSTTPGTGSGSAGSGASAGSNVPGGTGGASTGLPITGRSVAVLVALGLAGLLSGVAILVVAALGHRRRRTA